MRTLLASMMLLTSGLALAATEPSAARQAVQSRAQALNLPTEKAQLLLGALERAAAAGLPEETVADKVLEGLAKGVDASRIARAADEVTARLGIAQQALKVSGCETAASARRATLERLALAVQVSGEKSVLTLAEASKGAQAAGLAVAANQIGVLAARELGPEHAIPALAAMARARVEVGQIERLAALWDEYRAEGGREARAFAEEVRLRAERGQQFNDLVDPFADSSDPLNRGKGHKKEASGLMKKPGGSGSAGVPSLEREGRSGSAPGLDAASEARKLKACASKKSRPDCR